MPASTEKQSVRCPQCGRRYAVASERLGKSARCGCGQAFTLSPEAAEVEYELEPIAQPAPARPLTPSIGVPCQRHPEVAAMARCSQCSTAVCATCAFTYPGNIHLCPTCATQTHRPMSSKRKQLAIWSIVLAAWASLVFAVLFGGVVVGAIPIESEEAEIGFGMALMMFSFLPSLIGMGLGLSSRDKRLGNPAITHVGWIWNVILAGLWLFLTILGNLMG